MLPTTSSNSTQDHLIPIQKLRVQFEAKNSISSPTSINNIKTTPTTSFTYGNSGILSSMANNNTPPEMPNKMNPAQNMSWFTMQLFLQKIFAAKNFANSLEMKAGNFLQTSSGMANSWPNIDITRNNSFLTTPPINFYPLPTLRNHNNKSSAATTSHTNKKKVISTRLLPKQIFPLHKPALKNEDTNGLFKVRRVTGLMENKTDKKNEKTIPLDKSNGNKEEANEENNDQNSNGVYNESSQLIENSINETNEEFIQTNEQIHTLKNETNIAFETVLYNGRKSVQPNQRLFMPLNLRQICHFTANFEEANLNPIMNLALKTIRQGDEIVLLNYQNNFNFLPNMSINTMSKIYQQNNKFIIDGKFNELISKQKKTKNEGKVKFQSNLPIQSTSSAFVNQNINELNKIKQIRQTADQQHPGYSCARCGKVFSTSDYRDKHLKYTRCVDNGDRKFPCNLCTRSFEKRDRLRIHILHVHENHRPHVCRICTKAFSQSSSLNKHLRVHSGERPYHCQFCPKSFTASSILRTHVRQHSGEKPFKCVYCRKSFASHAAHDSHVRRTHESQ